MELKQNCYLWLCISREVLIVPLWNWNFRQNGGRITSNRFNRTFMELKHVSHHNPRIDNNVLIVPLWNWNLRKSSFFSVRRCFNRTFMELKQDTSDAEAVEFGSFNRTFMELKPSSKTYCSFNWCVLIVPLWNWNDDSKNHGEWP